MRKAMTCNVPARTELRVIYGVWEIADTSNSFYRAIDVDFGNGGNVRMTVPASNQSGARSSAARLQEIT